MASNVDKITVKIVNEELGTDYEKINWKKFIQDNVLTEEFLRKYIDVMYKQMKCPTFINFLQELFDHSNGPYETYNKIILSHEFIYSTFQYGYAKQFISHKYYSPNGLLYSEDFIEKWITEYPKQAYHISDVLINQTVSEDFIERHLDIINKNSKNWEYIAEYQKLSEDFIECYADKLPFETILQNQKLSCKYLNKHWNKIKEEHVWHDYWDITHSYNYIPDIIIWQHISLDFIEEHFNDLIKYETHNCHVFEDNELLYYNKSIITIDFIKKHWEILSKNANILYTLLCNYNFPLSFIEKYIITALKTNTFCKDKYLLEALLYNQKISFSFIKRLEADGILGKYENVWDCLLRKKCIPEYFIDENINKFSKKGLIERVNRFSEAFIKKHIKIFIKDTNYMFWNEHRKFSIDFLDQIAPQITKKMWKALSSQKGTFFPDWFIEKYADKLDWKEILNRPDITIERINKYRKYITEEMIMESNKCEEYIDSLSPEDAKALFKKMARRFF